MVRFKIGRLREKFFTRAQVGKLEAGIDIFHNLIQSKHFKDLVLKFHWTSRQGKTFRRFLHSNGLSNHQVLERFYNANKIFDEMGMKERVAILPCDSRKDIANFKLTANAIIWMSTSCLNNEWFTPVHVAAAICHEMMLNLGFKVKVEFNSQDDFDKTVPYAFGKIIMLASKQWENNISDIRSSFEVLDEEGFNYFPSSEVFCLEIAKNENQNYPNSIADILGKLEREAETLESINGDKSLAEQKRLKCLNKVKQQLINIHHDIIDSSLDGSEMMSTEKILRPGRQA